MNKYSDPKVDELLECALNNLEEAGKALASLGENTEHELKVDEVSEDEASAVLDSRVEMLASKIGTSRAHAIVHRAGRRAKKHD